MASLAQLRGTDVRGYVVAFEADDETGYSTYSPVAA